MLIEQSGEKSEPLILWVTDIDFEPIEELPLYVVIVYITLTLFPVTFAVARFKGGVNDTLVLVEEVQTVPVLLPHL